MMGDEKELQVSEEKELQWYLLNKLNREICFKLFPSHKKTDVHKQLFYLNFIFDLLDPVFYDWDVLTKWKFIKGKLAPIKHPYQTLLIEMMIKIIDARLDKGQTDIGFIYAALENINGNIEVENNQPEFPKKLSHSFDDFLDGYLRVRGFLKDKGTHLKDSLEDLLKDNIEHYDDIKKIVFEYISVSKYNEFNFEVKEGYEKIFKNSGEVLFAYLMENCTTASKKQDIGYFYRSMEIDYLKVGEAAFREWIRDEYGEEIVKIKTYKSDMDNKYNARSVNYQKGLEWFKSTSYYGN